MIIDLIIISSTVVLFRNLVSLSLVYSLLSQIKFKKIRNL